MAQLGAHSGGNLLPEIRRVSPYGSCIFRFCHRQDTCGLAFGEEAGVGFEPLVGSEVAGVHPGSVCRVESDAGEEFSIGAYRLLRNRISPTTPVWAEHQATRRKVLNFR